jgi:hypothetical protein
VTANPHKYLLANFPPGYRLFEHIKAREDSVKNKGHTGAGHARQDAYLYGHPGGRRKRYRSPGEFFHHMKYLLSEEELLAVEDCACKFCTPDELQPPREKKKRVSKKMVAADKDKKVVEVTDKPVVNAPVERVQAVPVAAKPASTTPLNAGPTKIPPNSPLTEGYQPTPSAIPPNSQWFHLPWGPGPAHSSHLSDRLDAETVQWLQHRSPKEYEDYMKFVSASMEGSPQAPGMWSYLVEKLDYLVYMGHVIPSYYPRRVVKPVARKLSSLLI